VFGLFKDAAYFIDDNTVATSRVGDILRVHGVLKTPSDTSETVLAPKFDLFELVDDTRSSVTYQPHRLVLERSFGTSQ
jgi:hypothetical protein